MGLGLVGLLSFLQTANPNSPIPYDSSKTVAEEIASYIMENGQREFIQDSGGFYVKCWLKIKRDKKENEIAEYRLCRANFRHPENNRLINSWFLRFVYRDPDVARLIVTDYGVSGHPQVCLFTANGLENPIPDPKECDSIYRSFISFLKTPSKEERENKN